MDGACFKEFCCEYTRELNRLRMEQRADLTCAERELSRLEARRQKLVQSIMDGVPGSEVKVELTAIAARREELSRILSLAQRPPVLLHPRTADVYRERVNQLCRALEDDESRSVASEAIRQLVQSIVLEPNATGDKLKVTLKGDLAGMLSAAQNAKRSPETDDLLVSIQLVAGAGFEPATFGL
jgi:site-specific DNA recombinase